MGEEGVEEGNEPMARNVHCQQHKNRRTSPYHYSRTTEGPQFGNLGKVTKEGSGAWEICNKIKYISKHPSLEGGDKVDSHPRDLDTPKQVIREASLKVISINGSESI